MQKIRTALFCMALTLAATSTVFAETAPSSLPDLDTIPTYDMPLAAETHHMLRIIKGKSRAIAVDRPVAAVTADPPGGAVQVFARPARTLNLLARPQDGLVHITAKEAGGGLIMARYIFVTDTDTHYLRAHVTCTAGQADAACGQERIFYCPDECFQMGIDLSE